MSRHVAVMFSSGIGSWAAAKRWRETFPEDRLTLLFADTNIEDEDNYRFLMDAAQNVLGDLQQRITDEDYSKEWEAHDGSGQLVWLTNGGTTIWQLFDEKQFLATKAADLCSRELKRVPLRRWCLHNDVDVVVMGFGFEEMHRVSRAAKHWTKWTVAAPMAHEPYMTKDMVLDWAREEGLEPPRLYSVGDGVLPHANCGGACVKAGQRMFEVAYHHLPEVFSEWERRETEFREKYDVDVAFLMRKTPGYKRRPLPLSEFRQEIEAGCEVDPLDVGSCNCMGE